MQLSTQCGWCIIRSEINRIEKPRALFLKILRQARHFCNVSICNDGALPRDKRVCAHRNLLHVNPATWRGPPPPKRTTDPPTGVVRGEPAVTVLTSATRGSDIVIR